MRRRFSMELEDSANVRLMLGDFVCDRCFGPAIRPAGAYKLCIDSECKPTLITMISTTTWMVAMRGRQVQFGDVVKVQALISGCYEARLTIDGIEVAAQRGEIELGQFDALTLYARTALRGDLTLEVRSTDGRAVTIDNCHEVA